MTGSSFFVGSQWENERCLDASTPGRQAVGKAHAQRPLAHACPPRIFASASFHVLRHTYASHLVTGRRTIAVVAANLGHATPEMTEKHYAIAPNYVALSYPGDDPKLGLIEPTNIALSSRCVRDNEKGRTCLETEPVHGVDPLIFSHPLPRG